MQCLLPQGPVYQAGTLSGNPITVTAGLATLSKIQVPGFYEKLTKTTEALCQGFASAATAANIPVCTSSVGSMFGWFFTDAKTVNSYEQAIACNNEQFKLFFHAMLNEGVYLAPSCFEAGFVSSQHSDAEIKATLDACERAFKSLAS